MCILSAAFLTSTATVSWPDAQPPRPGLLGSRAHFQGDRLQDLINLRLRQRAGLGQGHVRKAFGPSSPCRTASLLRGQNPERASQKCFHHLSNRGTARHPETSIPPLPPANSFRKALFTAPAQRWRPREQVGTAKEGDTREKKVAPWGVAEALPPGLYLLGKIKA